MRVFIYINLLKYLYSRKADFFQDRSWQSVEKLERFWGVWLLQSRFKNYLMRIIFVSLTVSAMITIVARLKKEWGVNLGIATENFLGIFLIQGGLIQLITCCIYNGRRQKIYEKVNEHFRTITEPEEAFVLSKSAEHTMRFCIKYMSVFLSTDIIFFVLPIGRMIFGYLMYNGKLEKLLPYYADYVFIDEDKYYVPVMLHIISMASFFITAQCAHDFGFIMSVRHVCALFEIVKIRLREASGFLDEFEWDMLDYTTANNKAYDLITKAIDLHNEALEMVPLIEEAYKFCWLAILLMNSLIFNGGAYMVILNLNNPFNLLRYFTFFVALFVHFSVIFAHGQMIIDTSSSVFDACYNVKWYVASTKTRKLLSIMMSRSFKPSVITGGNLFVISMETFGKMMKVAFSYLSVFTRNTDN